MIVFPVVATFVSFAFAGALLKQYARKRRLPQLAWGIALVQFGIATAVVALALADRWDATLYRVFWLFGALLNVPWLALGSVALIWGVWSRRLAVVAVVAASVYAAVATFGAAVDRTALAATDGIPRGRDVWIADPGMTTLARWYSIVAWLIVVGIALWSSRRVGGVAPPRERVRGNWLIAAGVSIVAIGGFALSRIGRGSAFSVSLALGVVVMFAGFVLASRAPRYRVEEPGESPT